MRFILDTHVFLWWITSPEKLSKKVFRTMESGANELFLSPASSWEITIKCKIKRLQLPKEPALYIPQKMINNNIRSLAIEHIHALETFNLPLFHKDPFDRMIVAQSMVEDIPILSKDPLLKKYKAAVIW